MRTKKTLIIKDETKIPVEFYRFDSKGNVKLNKRELFNHIRCGLKIEGVEIKEEEILKKG